MRQDIATFGMNLVDQAGAVSDLDYTMMLAMFQDAFYRLQVVVSPVEQTKFSTI